MRVTDLFLQSDGSLKCPYCTEKYSGRGGFYQHIRFAHKQSSKDVFDEFIKKDTDGRCIICGGQTDFRYGKYLLTCSPECKAMWSSVNYSRALKISKKKRRYDTESFIIAAHEVHGARFDYSQTNIGCLQDKIIISCKKHGTFETVAAYHLQDKCGGCKKCASESMIETKDAWSAEKKEYVKRLRRKTNIEKFGHEAGPNPFGSAKFEDLMVARYGVRNVFSSKEFQVIIKNTNLEKYGVTNPAYLEKTIIASHTKQANRKRYVTHKKNNSFTASAPEEDFHEFLLTMFDADDVFRHYADDPRYPYACDFYIRSQDLFIELNLFFTHGFHWFNSDDPRDVEKLALWKERTNGKDLYHGAIHVWTVSDPKKRETAIRNNLNYVVLWNLEDIERYKNELRERLILE